MEMTPQGGLNQARPPQPAAQPAAQPDQPAMRVAGMEQETPGEDFFARTMRDLQEQRKVLDAQTQRLMQSLDARQNRPFDPVLMRAAAGFLKPTKTGSFGESLGYAMEGVADEGEKEVIRNQATEKLRVELLQQQAQRAQQQAIQRYMMSKFGGEPQPGGAPAGAPAGAPSGMPAGAPPGMPAGMPSGAPAAAPSGAPAGMPAGAPTGAPAGLPAAAPARPAEGRRITQNDINEAMILDPSGKIAERLSAQMKLQIDADRLRQTDPANPDNIVEVDFGPRIGLKKIPLRIYHEFDRRRAVAEATGNAQSMWEFAYAMGLVEPPPGADRGTAPPTVEQRARDEAIRRQRAEQQIKDEAPRITKIETNADTARDFRRTAASMDRIATSNPRAFDLMNDPGIAMAVMRAAQEGIKLGNFGSISIPATTLYQGARLPQADREALQLFAKDYAELTTQFRKAARVPGEGAITDREGNLYASLGALPTDTARVIRMKSEFIRERAKYDEAVFRAWADFSKNPQHTLRDFMASDRMNALRDAYDARLGEIQTNNADLLRTSRASGPGAAAPQPASRPAAQPSQQPATASRPPPRVRAGTPAYNALSVGSLYEDETGTIREKK